MSLDLNKLDKDELQLLFGGTTRDETIAPEPSAAVSSLYAWIYGLQPMNKVVIALIILAWSFIVLQQNRHSMQPPPDDDAGGYFTTVDGIQDINESGFDGADRNQTSILNPDGSTLLDKNTTTGCQVFGIGCLDGQTPFGLGPNTSTFIGGSVFANDGGAKKSGYDLTFQEANAKSECSALTRAEAFMFFCQRDIMNYTHLSHVAVGYDKKRCQREMDIGYCPLYKTCIYNIAKKHFRKEKAWWLFDPRLYANEDGSERLAMTAEDIADIKNACT